MNHVYWPGTGPTMSTILLFSKICKIYFAGKPVTCVSFTYPVYLEPRDKLLPGVFHHFIVLVALHFNPQRSTMLTNTSFASSDAVLICTFNIGSTLLGEVITHVIEFTHTYIKVYSIQYGVGSCSFCSIPKLISVLVCATLTWTLLFWYPTFWKWYSKKWHSVV